MKADDDEQPEARQEDVHEDSGRGDEQEQSVYNRCEQAGRSVRGSEPLLRLSIQSVLLLGDGDRLVEHGVLENVSL